MRLLVCGSRTWTDRARLWQVLDQLVSRHGDGQVTVIEGDARGADRLAGQLARQRGWRLERYPADWTRHGKAAGPRRNARMLREGHPDRWWPSPSARSNRAGEPPTWCAAPRRPAYPSTLSPPTTPSSARGRQTGRRRPGPAPHLSHITSSPKEGTPNA
jgi:YspA, cpYpsA-related SLOG family